MLTFSAAIKMIFDVKEYVKEQSTIHRPQYNFYKKSRDQVNQIIDQLIYQNVSPM